MNRYEREKPGTGGWRAAVNYKRNMAYQAEAEAHTNDRGWVEPFMVWQGWEELNRAIYGTKRMLILRKHMKHHELAEGIRVAKLEIYRSSKCRRPILGREG